MLSIIPTDLKKLYIEDIEKEAIRASIIGELDAINLYEQMAAVSGNTLVKKVLLDIAKEEKVHVGELMALLEMADAEQTGANREGKKEVEDLKK